MRPAREPNLTHRQLRQLHVQPVPSHRRRRRRPARRRSQRCHDVETVGAVHRRRTLREGGAVPRSGHTRPRGRCRRVRGPLIQRGQHPGARRVPRAPVPRQSTRRSRDPSAGAHARPAPRGHPRRLTAVHRDPVRDGVPRRTRRRVYRDQVSLARGGVGVVAGVPGCNRVDGGCRRRRRRRSRE